MADLKLDHLHEAKATIGSYLESGDEAGDTEEDIPFLLYAIASALTSIAESLDSLASRTD